MRYRGTESALMILKPGREEACSSDWAFGGAFVRQYDQEFGFTFPDRDIIMDDVRVRGIGKGFRASEKTVDQQIKESIPTDVSSGEYCKSLAYFEGGRLETPIFKLDDLKVGNRVRGPAILADVTQTNLVTSGASALLTKTHVVINLGASDSSNSKTSIEEVHPILLSVFSDRFMAIAEQMG